MTTNWIVLSVMCISSLFTVLAGCVGVVLAQVPGADEVIKGASAHGWESGVIAASILAIVAGAIGGLGYIGFRLFGKRDGIITNETARVRERWAEHVATMEGFHLKQGELCKVHAAAADRTADTFTDVVGKFGDVAAQCAEARKSQTCMCAVMEQLVVIETAKHDSKGSIEANLKDREDFAKGMMALADNDPVSVHRAMERIVNRKVREAQHRQDVKAKLEESMKEE